MEMRNYLGSRWLESCLLGIEVRKCFGFLWFVFVCRVGPFESIPKSETTVASFVCLFSVSGTSNTHSLTHAHSLSVITTIIRHHHIHSFSFYPTQLINYFITSTISGMWNSEQHKGQPSFSSKVGRAVSSSPLF